MEPSAAFGTVLRMFRKKAKMSQEKLAAGSNLDRTYISLLERGIRQPSLSSIISLSKTLKISAAKMIAAVEKIMYETKRG